jgi:hypothetical protein
MIYIGIVLIIFVTIFLIYIAKQSPEMNISREMVIKATPEKIFPYINNSRKSNEWMPWATIDPKLVMNYSGPDEGIGSTSSWDSPGQMGTGSAVIIENEINKFAKSKLSYIKPMQMEQIAIISLSPAPDGTLVNWSVTGQNPFIGRLICFFMNMDKMVGGNFMMGLQKLKSIVEN